MIANSKSEANKFSPRDFMRSRRPEKFSDSSVEERNSLDRQMLEYFLSTLTSRNQELDFELFAQKLAEYTICPNLIPHTGPTGGGDSKVDSETFPVADELALAWHIGIGREAAQERWAFAFSTKADWKSKVKSDIAKIEATKRGYSKAFFISSQFIPDKKRAEIEDELCKKYKLDVRVLDRSWILDNVFKNQLQNLAIDTLNLSSSLKSEIETGPKDLERERDLSALEQRINEVAATQCYSISFVADCIDVAKLSRELEKPQLETDGRFQRAKRAAEVCGTEHQRLMVSYQWAWTSYWWHEDIERFIELYKEVEHYAIGSINSYDLELLLNLWLILHSLSSRGEINIGDKGVEEHTNVLTAQLERLSRETTRPSAALQAKTFLLHIILQKGLLKKQPALVDEALKGFFDVISQCDGLIGFSFDPLVNILTELGELLESNSTYEALFDKIIEVSSTRDKKSTTANLLFSRASNQLQQNKTYAAIKTFGRCFQYLYTDENRNNLVRALYLCGYAYQEVGLQWAAHGSFLNAASLATNEYWSYSEITIEQVACFKKIKWLELQLGRLPHILAWHEIEILAGGILTDKGYDRSKLLENEHDFDVILGILCLRADLDQLRRMTTLPDILLEMGLHATRLAILFALGHEDVVIEELRSCGINTSDELRNHFEIWMQQPACDEISSRLYLYEGHTCFFESRLLGCKISVEVENSPASVLLAESILAALESFCATGIEDGLISAEPRLIIKVRQAAIQSQPICFLRSDCDGTPMIEIMCAIDSPCGIPFDQQEDIKKKLFSIIADIFSVVVTGTNITNKIERLFADAAVNRAINFTGSLVTLTNVLGSKPKTTIDTWNKNGAKNYPLRRSRPWRDAVDEEIKPENQRLNMGREKPPAEVLSHTRIRHDEFETVSVIRQSIWDKARWVATAYVGVEDDSQPGILALVFKNAEAAATIFRKWREEFGSDDDNEVLRVCIIRHIHKAKPYSYRVVIGMHPEVAFRGGDTKRAVMVSRINTMGPISDSNLQKFIQTYNRHNKYGLCYAVIQDDGGFPKIDFKSGIVKKTIHIRDAWEIGINDCDGVAILRDDDPIIPVGQPNAPVIELLRELRSKPNREEGQERN